jgi:hypothetical protein
VGPWDLQLCHQQALLQQQAASELVAHLVDNAWLGASLLQAWRLLQETMAFKIKYQSCAMQAMMSSIHSFIHSAAAKTSVLGRGSGKCATWRNEVSF